MKTTPSLLIAASIPLLSLSLRAAEWTPITDSLLKRATAQDEKEIWPGGCAGVAVNRLTGDVTVKVVGHGLWRSADQGKTWTRLDKEVITGRDETGWATNLDQNSPTRLASFSLDGTAGWTTDGTTWKKFADLKPNSGGFKFTADWFGCYAWDPVNNIVYASSMGNPVFKLALEK